MDELLLLSGKPFHLTSRVTVANPKLADILDFSEEKYFSTVTALTATAYDFRIQLDDIGLDYVDIEDYDMFLMIAPTLKYEETQIILPDVHFEQLQMITNKTTGEVALAEVKEDFLGRNKPYEVIFDRFTYHEMVDYIRSCHGLERNWMTPGNRGARRILIDDERERIKREGVKPFKSVLGDMVSTLVNMPGFEYNYDTVWELSIYQFLNAARRIEKIRASDHAYARINSGFFDMKKANKSQLNKELNYMGEL